ncbi:MAG: EpsG family protein [Acidobacteriota bacterium]|nr:EpsG family protein [Acidobacteriota bacterium]
MKMQAIDNVSYKEVGVESQKSLLLFVFWPFLALITALRDFRTKESKIVIYFFLILFGATYYLGNPDFDSFHLYEKFDMTSRQSFSEWRVENIDNIIDTAPDIVQPILLFVLSRIDSSPAFLFGTFAAIFGGVFLISINILASKYSLESNINAKIYFTFFLFINPIFNINGFRFWTAAWIFFIGAYFVVVNRDKKHLILALSSILFHASFVVPNIILVAYVTFGNKDKIYNILFSLSLAIPEIFRSQLSVVEKYMLPRMVEKYFTYTNPLFIERTYELQENLKWFMKVQRYGLYYFAIFMLFYLKYIHKKNQKISINNNLFSFSILFISIINFMSWVPVMGRFRTLFYLFAFTFMISVLSEYKSKKIHPTTSLGLVPMSFAVIIALRVGSEMTNIWLFFPLAVSFIAAPTSLYEVLISLF